MRGIACLLLVAVAAGAEPRPIRLPEIPAEPVPLPVTTIGANQLYVIDSDVQLIPVTSPTGVLVVTAETGMGPLRIKAEFADRPGRYETRTYSGKYVYCIEAASNGSCELLLVPVGVKAEHEIIRRQLTAQTGPRPPPIPTPVPPEPVKAARLQIVVVEDVLNRSVETATVLNATAMWAEFASKGHEWRFYDSTTAEPRGKVYVSEIDVAKLPQLLIRDRDKDAKLAAVPLPKDTSAIRAIVSQFSK